MRTLKYVFVILCAIAVLQVGFANDVIAGNGPNGKAFDCSIAGAWILYADSNHKDLSTITPIDPTGKRFAVIVNPIPTGEPDLYFTPYHGTMVKIGRNLYEYTIHKYKIVNPLGFKLIKVVVTGITELTDCDNRVTASSYEVHGLTETGWKCIKDGTSDTTASRIEIEPVPTGLYCPPPQ